MSDWSDGYNDVGFPWCPSKACSPGMPKETFCPSCAETARAMDFMEHAILAEKARKDSTFGELVRTLDAVREELKEEKEAHKSTANLWLKEERDHDATCEKLEILKKALRPYMNVILPGGICPANEVFAPGGICADPPVPPAPRCDCSAGGAERPFHERSCRAWRDPSPEATRAFEDLQASLSRVIPEDHHCSEFRYYAGGFRCILCRRKMRYASP